MQPVLLGRSFAPLQGETGLCTAEIPSNHQTTKPPGLQKTTVVEREKKKDKRHHFTPAEKHLIGAERGEGVGELGDPSPISASSSAISISARWRANP